MEQSTGPTDSNKLKLEGLDSRHLDKWHWNETYGMLVMSNDDTEQIALFDPPPGDEALIEQNTDPKEKSDLTSGSHCCFCGCRVSREDPTTHEEVTSWVRGKKKDSAVLRTRSGRLACEDCINKMRAGISVDQQDYETLLDEPPQEVTVDTIFSDRHPNYQLGYEHGRDGLPSAISTVDPPFGPMSEEVYREGYSDGEQARIAKERLGTPLADQA